LGIQKEPYELQREALLQQGAMGVEAGREGDVRGAAATVGRVQMAQQEAQAGIRTAMGQELTDLAKLTAAEESRLRDVGVGLDLEEVAGAQLAAANAQEMGAQAVQQGMQGITSLGQQVAEAVPLFGKKPLNVGLAAPKTDMTQQTATALRAELPKTTKYNPQQREQILNKIAQDQAKFRSTPTATQRGYPNMPNYIPQLSGINFLDYLRPR